MEKRLLVGAFFTEEAAIEMSEKITEKITIIERDGIYYVFVLRPSDTCEKGENK
jgi:hypothetical protein